MLIERMYPMKIVIVALLFLVANVAAALGCLGNDRQVIAIINKVPQLFVFTKGATSVSGGASRNGKLCRLEANFNTLHAGFVCGEERKEGRLVGVNRRGSFALLFDQDDPGVVLAHFAKVRKFVATQIVARGCFGGWRN
jgi:hypothetical protein